MKESLHTVIITGGNHGLGYACAKRILLDWRQAYVVLACLNDQGKPAISSQLSYDKKNRNDLWIACCKLCQLHKEDTILNIEDVEYA